MSTDSICVNPSHPSHPCSLLRAAQSPSPKEITPRRPKPSRRNPFHPESRRSVCKGCGDFAVHAAVAEFISRTPASLKTVLTPAGRRCRMRFREPPQLPVKALASPLGFCCGGFPPPPVYVPAKRGTCPKTRAAALLEGRSIPPSAARFYPGARASLPTHP